MTVYLGDKAVGANTIVEVPKTKFGASIDNLLGTVDADGNYIPLSEPFEVNLAGVKRTTYNGYFPYKFYKSSIKKLIANDLVSIGGSSDFVGVCEYSMQLEEAHFDNLEEINANHTFSNAFRYCYNAKKITFSKLKKVTGSSVFKDAFSGIGNSGPVLNIEEIFPALEEISNDVFSGFITYSYYVYQGKPIIFPAVKKITGGSSYYTGNTFYSFYTNNTVWHFPSATEFSGYIWNNSASYPGEIHFAAANQAAIEACDGYADKWGFAGATIYFDL